MCARRAVTSCLCSSLANVVPAMGVSGTAPTGDALPGFLRQLSRRQLATLLDALEVSQRAANAFDSRPGLKFLVQKVCGMERAANLYGQAGAAWTLHAVTLLHLAVAEGSAGSSQPDKGSAGSSQPDKDGAEPSQPTEGGDGSSQPAGRIAVSSQSDGASPSQPTKGKDGAGSGQPTEEGSETSHLAALGSLLSDACARYCQMVQDSDRHDGQLERAAEQPVFFLLAQSDDYPGAYGGQTEPPPPPAQTGAPAVGPPRPFGFADLARSPVSEPEAAAGGDREHVEPELGSGSPAATPCSDHDDEAATESGPAESDDQVYSVLTDRQLSCLIGQYKRRKPTRAMPGTTAPALCRRNPFLTGRTAAPQRPAEPVPPEIEHQRRSSLIKVRADRRHSSSCSAHAA